MKLMPGDKISYKVFFLEMNTPPDCDWPLAPFREHGVYRSMLNLWCISNWVHRRVAPRTPHPTR